MRQGYQTTFGFMGVVDEGESEECHRIFVNGSLQTATALLVSWTRARPCNAPKAVFVCMSIVSRAGGVADRTTVW